MVVSALVAYGAFDGVANPAPSFIVGMGLGIAYAFGVGFTYDVDKPYFPQVLLSTYRCLLPVFLAIYLTRP